MTVQTLYKRSNMNRLGEFGKLTPDALQSFVQFNNHALAEEHLSAKLKELIAVAVAHTTGCAYCIDTHVKKAKALGMTKEEMAEVILVATALKAGAALAHGVNALNAFDEIDNEELYKASYINRLPEFLTSNEESFKAFFAFDKQAMKRGLLSVKEKELIAIAVAHTTGCPYCIDIHVKGAKRAKATKEEIAESIIVATALKAGSALAHGVNALESYDQ
ncbi:carboxymuconolactone decarboxylase family protein [Sporosarcina sp. HYO08]|uniref:carboxymuconolactone decarboxylase family protein n=1 Tax=Sporosarcina sp. HYO08 TaxID=1759557 RepID=UPI0007949238|nr:carboxymuconolactone decarboxylase family protein [Sporosarcina sp. HYO08]KXH86093.1 alkylhydroperoxidase [Sporosarcina sp. HYO08]